MEVGMDRYDDIGEIQGSHMDFGSLLTGKNSVLYTLENLGEQGEDLGAMPK